MVLSELYIHPLKSGAPLPLPRARVEPRGLEHDRRWMVVDPDRRFLTGRQVPALVRVRARADARGLGLATDGHRDLQVPAPPADAPRLRVRVWKDEVDAALAGEPADHWLTAVLGRPVRLVYMDEQALRPVRPHYGRAGDLVSFADSFPLMLISQAALDGLNTRLSTPASMLRFRPNLVVDDCPAHAEDRWRGLRIGSVEFEVSKPCTRCVFTTVDPASGRPDPAGEPLRTLTTYRRGELGVTFGMHLIARGSGTVAVGDGVEVLD